MCINVVEIHEKGKCIYRKSCATKVKKQLINYFIGIYIFLYGEDVVIPSPSIINNYLGNFRKLHLNFMPQ